ncbi:hypothetical protein BDP27DRAFT_1343505 [Rhodocollybia butyracea]|uniref:Uncharacterized protein n=1 Tax=Rhodocollybia butyracea TaxID=206335 RepID=A0A9P5P856_9AGAR|nr:hypothetical protein BDP27DRAFT_1343505 [Rhodocollybia butyracea]
MVDATLTETDVELIQQASRYQVPLSVIRAKSDTRILASLQDAGYFDASDPRAVQLTKNAVSSSARVGTMLQLQKAGLPLETRFYQVNKHTLYAVVKEDERRLAAYGKYEIDERRLVGDLRDDVENGGRWGRLG